jgi:aryl-alcohol dehydrogenase-like predicted oxidoreductase
MKLALGGAQFGLVYGIANQGGQVRPDVLKGILELSRAQGVDTIDTAKAYGESESALGVAGTEGFNVITKLPSIPFDVLDVQQWVASQVAHSLRNLRVDAVYGLMLHRSHEWVGPHGKALVCAMQSLKAQGLVHKIGVSIYAPSELTSVMQAGGVDLVQAPFNLVDRSLVESGWLQKLKAIGVEVHARSVFLQGLLLMPRDAIPAKFQRWAKLWDTWQAWQQAANISAVQACIGFVQSHTMLDRLVVGMDSLEQLQQLIDASQHATPADWPDIGSQDVQLINPSYWPTL